MAKRTIYLCTLLSVLLITGCSPVKKLNRLHNKYPYLFEKKIDTLTVRDTVSITIPGVNMDTTVLQSVLMDTIVLTKDHIKTIVYQKGDTVYINTEADTIHDYIPVEIRVPVQKYIADVNNKPFHWWMVFVVILGVLIVIFLYQWKKE